MSDFTSELFNTLVQSSRTEALPALQARAEREGKILTTCGWCQAFMGEQDGNGVSGLSTGICPPCEEALRLQTATERTCVDCGKTFRGPNASWLCIQVNHLCSALEEE
jgi:hypothetical protein